MIIEKKEKADLIIIGAGILGASTAYYYKRDNPDREVLVVEKNELCSGNTSMAAALMSRARVDRNAIPLSTETYEVIPELEKLTTDKIPVRYNGAIHVASDEISEKKLSSILSGLTDYGIEWEYITEHQARSLVRWLDCTNSSRIAFISGEAITDPYLLCMAFINASKKLGVKYLRNVEVIQLLKSENVVYGILTKDGKIEAPNSVLAAGAWSTKLAFEAGISLPMAAIRSQYWISEPLLNVFNPDDPVVIIPGAGFYARPQGNSLLFGVREQQSVYTSPDKLPDKIEDHMFSNDNGIKDLIDNFRKIIPFFPSFGDTGIKNYIAGFSCYTPDNLFIAGRINETEGLLTVTGCCGAGISAAGGLGRGVALLAAQKPNPFDFSNYSPDRFGQINPFSEEHMIKCGLSRSAKTSG